MNITNLDVYDYFFICINISLPQTMSKQTKKNTSDGYLKVSRKGYTRKDGTKVKATTYYTPDKGEPGRGPKTLPSISKNPKDSLGQFGYKVSLPFTRRKEALDNAVKIHGALSVLRRLNLIRNYTAEIDNKARLSRDVDYLKSTYAAAKPSKSSKAPKPPKAQKQSGSKNQKSNGSKGSKK